MIVTWQYQTFQAIKKQFIKKLKGQWSRHTFFFQNKTTSQPIFPQWKTKLQKCTPESSFLPQNLLLHRINNVKLLEVKKKLINLKNAKQFLRLHVLGAHFTLRHTVWEILYSSHFMRKVIAAASCSTILSSHCMQYFSAYLPWCNRQYLSISPCPLIPTFHHTLCLISKHNLKHMHTKQKVL